MSTSRLFASFPDEASCPCLSGSTVQACNCKARGFVPARVDTDPRGVVTGLQLKGCYAKSTKNCRPPMSAEHHISAAILRDLGPNGNIFRTLNDERVVEISISSAGKKVLCQRHNTALSPLDRLGQRFVSCLGQVTQSPSDPKAQNSEVIFSAYDIQRWMLKALCGASHGEKASRRHRSSVWTVPPDWLRILFVGGPFPSGSGMYVRRERRASYPNGVATEKIVGSEFDHINGVTLLDPDPPITVVGITFLIFGFEIDFLMMPMEDLTPYAGRVACVVGRSPSGAYSAVHLRQEDLLDSSTGLESVTVVFDASEGQT